LRGLAARAHEEQQSDREVGAPTDGIGRLGEDLAVGERAERRPDEHDAEAEAEVTHAVDDEGLLARVRGRLLLVPEADQEVRAESDRLPEHVEDEEVGRQHQHHHGEDEEVEVGEETGVAVIPVHVSGRVEMDQEADSRDHEQHDGGELVHLHRHRRREAAGADPREELAHVRLAVEHAREDEARGDEGQAQRGHGDPVRGASGKTAEERVQQRAREREERNQPDES
jgi:hypothetical protein